MFQLVASEESRRDADKLVRFFASLGLRIDRSEQQEIQSVITRGFEMNFSQASSGQGPWAPLAPATQADRAQKGFPPARPLLTRTWDYRNSLTDPNDDQHFSQVYQSSNLYAQEEGSESPLFPWHERGTPRMPARSVTHLSRRSEDELGDMLDSIVTRLLRRDGL
ncbi:MAG: hypothetical protein IT328_20170 [Caldilineaceae bacterium]|nr:hypothetical protein [Caldilineaceae bacterium]